MSLDSRGEHIHPDKTLTENPKGKIVSRVGELIGTQRENTFPVETVLEAIELSFSSGEKNMPEQVKYLLETIFIDDRLSELYKGRLAEIAGELCYGDSSLFKVVFAVLAEHMTDDEFEEALDYVLSKNRNTLYAGGYGKEINDTMHAIRVLDPEHRRSGLSEKIEILFSKLH